MRHYCTYFDSHYASRALALHASLRRHGHPFKLWALCLDDEVHDFITGLELNDVVAFKLVDLEAQFPALSVAKTTRSRIEFYFTCTPFLPAFVFQHEASAELVTYLDADLFFYSSIEPLFAEFGDASVGIIAHRWPKGREGMVVYGIYNVGLIIFRRDEHASKCLAWWGERCLASCCTDPARGVYGDQKYLDEWPQLFHGVKVLQHKGGNVGVWNIGNHPVGYQGSTLLIGDEPLVFFHFHGLKRVGSKYFDLSSCRTRAAAERADFRRYFSRPISSLYSQLSVAIRGSLQKLFPNQNPASWHIGSLARCCAIEALSVSF
jgi:hypothetical protein